MKAGIKKATTGLAGAVAIAGGSQAYGAIVNVPVPTNLSVPAGADNESTVGWDVNGDGTKDFTFNIRYPNLSGVLWQDNMDPVTVTGNTVLGYGTALGYRFGSAFSAGTSIGPTAPTGTAFQTVGQVIMGSLYDGTPYGGFSNPIAPGNGSVTPGTLSYAGFSFTVGANTYYGWLQMSANAGAMNFVSAAYNDTPGASIAAGASAAVPEPGTLAGLAVGAVALGGTAWSRRRRATA